MFHDYIQNGRGYGEIGEALEGARFDPGLMRPYFNEVGQRCVTINTGSEYDKESGKYLPKYEEVLISEVMNRSDAAPVLNATTLRKDQWIKMDEAVVKSARQRLKCFSDIAAANSETIDGMSVSMYEWEKENDPGSARQDMDGLTEGRTDDLLYSREGLPLPITHSGFWYSKRVLETSRRMGQGFDVTRAEMAARRVAEQVEKVAIGTATGVVYGDSTNYGRTSTVYGLTNFPDRVTKTNMATPDGTNGTTILTNWLALRELMYTAKFYGPFMAYVSDTYTQFLDNLFSTTEPSAGTLRENLLKIDGIMDIRRLDYLTGTSKYDVLLVQMTPDVVRAIIGLPMTTIQWETHGGLKRNFKTMCIHALNIRSDYSGNCGIGHGTIS